MTSITRQYSAAASQARSAVEKTTDFWTQGARTLTDLLPEMPQVDLVPAVERYFDFMQRTVEMNRSLAVRWAEAAGRASGVVREQADSVTDGLLERAESAAEVVREKAADVEQAGREQAEMAERAEKELAREARKTEREQARRKHDKARERYEGRTKAELSDLLTSRDLPKSGNIDELIERLAEADTK